MASKIGLVSIFRNNAGSYIEFYKAQFQRLRWPPENLRVYIGEGDSIDNTLAQLNTWAREDDRVRVVKFDTGFAQFGSVVHPERFKALARTYNAVLSKVAEEEWAEHIFYTESDLAYDPWVLLDLLAHDRDLVAPFVMCIDNNTRLPHFYDTWAFRDVSGRNLPFRSWAWYTRSFFPETDLFELSSCGSAFLARADAIYNGARLTETEAIRGFCQAVKKKGYKIWLDPDTVVFHP